MQPLSAFNVVNSRDKKVAGKASLIMHCKGFLENSVFVHANDVLRYSLRERGKKRNGDETKQAFSETSSDEASKF